MNLNRFKLLYVCSHMSHDQRVDITYTCFNVSAMHEIAWLVDKYDIHGRSRYFSKTSVRLNQIFEAESCTEVAKKLGFLPTVALNINVRDVSEKRQKSLKTTFNSLESKIKFGRQILIQQNA